MKNLNWKAIFKVSGRMSFTNILESKIDIPQRNHYIFENAHQHILIVTPHHSPCLLIFDQKCEMNLIKT